MLHLNIICLNISKSLSICLVFEFLKLQDMSVIRADLLSSLSCRLAVNL